MILTHISDLHKYFLARWNNLGMRCKVGAPASPLDMIIKSALHLYKSICVVTINRFENGSITQEA